MKTAVALPDELFHAAERYARRLSRSRSRLYADAISEYLVWRDNQGEKRATIRMRINVATEPRVDVGRLVVQGAAAEQSQRGGAGSPSEGG